MVSSKRTGHHLRCPWKVDPEEGHFKKTKTLVDGTTLVADVCIRGLFQRSLLISWGLPFGTPCVFIKRFYSTIIFKQTGPI